MAPREPIVPEEVRAAFIASVAGALATVYPDTKKCPFSVKSNILQGLTGPEFMVTIREDNAFVSERLAEIVSPHPPVIGVALYATLRSLETLRIHAELRKEKDEDGDSLFGAAP